MSLLNQSDLQSQLLKHDCHVHLSVDYNISPLLLPDLLIAANHPNRFVHSPRPEFISAVRAAKSNLITMNMKMKFYIVVPVVMTEGFMLPMQSCLLVEPVTRRFHDLDIIRGELFRKNPLTHKIPLTGGSGGRSHPTLSKLCARKFITCCVSPYDTLGAIFSEEQKDSSIELAFKYAVYKINKDRSVLPKTTLVYDIQYVPDSTDSFRTSKKVCKQIENGVTAIFGKRWIPFRFTTRSKGSLSHLVLALSLLLKRTPVGSAALAPHPINLRSFRYTSFRDSIRY